MQCGSSPCSANYCRRYTELSDRFRMEKKKRNSSSPKIFSIGWKRTSAWDWSFPSPLAEVNADALIRNAFWWRSAKHAILLPNEMHFCLFFFLPHSLYHLGYFCGNLFIQAFNPEKYILSPSSIRSVYKLTSTGHCMQQGRGLKPFLRNSRSISTYPNGFAG